MFGIFELFKKERQFAFNVTLTCGDQSTKVMIKPQTLQGFYTFNCPYCKTRVRTHRCDFWAQDDYKFYDRGFGNGHDDEFHMLVWEY